MQHFEFRVQGLGPSPIVLTVMTRNMESARAMAERMHRDSKVLANIDVWQAKRYLFTVGQPTSFPKERSTPTGLAADSPP